MDRSPPSRGQLDVTTLSKVFVTLLFLAALAVTIPEVLAGDLDAFVTSAPTVFLTGALAVGVFWNATDTRRWQLAFFGGLTVITSGRYVESGDPFDLLLVVGCTAMVVGLALDAFRE